MKFPRNAKPLRNSFDMAPFAAVLFLLVIFLMLGALLPTQGIRFQLQPPETGDLPGVDKPTVAMAIDSGGRYYFANQIVSETELKSRLGDAGKKSRVPLTLVIHADKTVTEDQLIHLSLLARAAGIQSALLATLPGAASASAPP